MITELFLIATCATNVGCQQTQAAYMQQPWVQQVTANVNRRVEIATEHYGAIRDISAPIAIAVHKQFRMEYGKTVLEFGVNRSAITWRY